MRSFQLRHLLPAWLAICAIPLSAVAQQAAPQPPRMEILAEDNEAPGTVRATREPATTSEKRVRGGIVTEITVNSGGSTYYLKPNSPIGASLPGDTENNRLRGAQWGVLQFDFGGSRQPGTLAPQAQQPPAAAPPVNR